LTNEADHIITFTRLDLIDGAGSAYILGTCLPLNESILNQKTKLYSRLTILSSFRSKLFNSISYTDEKISHFFYLNLDLIFQLRKSSFAIKSHDKHRL
jgi:hypothetical protein